jgi:hypothetical protein
MPYKAAVHGSFVPSYNGVTTNALVVSGFLSSHLMQCFEHLTIDLRGGVSDTLRPSQYQRNGTEVVGEESLRRTVCCRLQHPSYTAPQPSQYLTGHPVRAIVQ